MTEIDRDGNHTRSRATASSHRDDGAQTVRNARGDLHEKLKLKLEGRGKAEQEEGFDVEILSCAVVYLSPGELLEVIQSDLALDLGTEGEIGRVDIWI
ncbi:hypothetical protein DTO271D3_4294 [Paecilomyces variotii]|nr:hypothetical protein DTO271D3_4294 [Paecilomyces variotii]